MPALSAGAGVVRLFGVADHGIGVEHLTDDELEDLRTADRGQGLCGPWTA
jgi:hypothetical protein